jgi:PTS system nitrogen regulatory IIA component
MGNEMMDLDQLAVYLQRDAREVSRMASRGYLPGHKISGEWRFHPAEINHWIETQMHAYTEQELTALENGPERAPEQGPLLSALLTESTMAVPLRASSRASVLKELVQLAEQSWQIYDPEALLDAIRQREEMGSTALDSGVAVPHPRRALPRLLGDHVVAYGRTLNPIPFGSGRSGLTDIFFLVCCRDDRTQLRVLARLSRLMLRSEFVDELRAAATPADTLQVIEAAEQELVGA